MLFSESCENSLDINVVFYLTNSIDFCHIKVCWKIGHIILNRRQVTVAVQMAKIAKDHNFQYACNNEYWNNALHITI